mmetsp:Transcript_28888/g.52337  ORF Transcript_28888/g.52337 Transcript_28888/m.52337 type:complete len:252 (+) Transcript_28888:3104-3859(+)
MPRSAAAPPARRGRLNFTTPPGLSPSESSSSSSSESESSCSSASSSTCLSLRAFGSMILMRNFFAGSLSSLSSLPHGASSSESSSSLSSSLSLSSKSKSLPSLSLSLSSLAKLNPTAESAFFAGAGSVFTFLTSSSSSVSSKMFWNSSIQSSTDLSTGSVSATILPSIRWKVKPSSSTSRSSMSFVEMWPSATPSTEVWFLEKYSIPSSLSASRICFTSGFLAPFLVSAILNLPSLMSFAFAGFAGFAAAF